GKTKAFNISVCQFLNVLTTELNAVRELLSTVSNHLYKFSLTLLESLVLNHSCNAFFKRYASARSGCNFSNSCTRAFPFCSNFSGANHNSFLLRLDTSRSDLVKVCFNLLRTLDIKPSP